MENNLLYPDQSDFIPGDSCIHQLISITHEICITLFASHPSLEVACLF